MNVKNKIVIIIIIIMSLLMLVVLFLSNSIKEEDIIDNDINNNNLTEQDYIKNKNKLINHDEYLSLNTISDIILHQLIHGENVDYKNDIFNNTISQEYYNNYITLYKANEPNLYEVNEVYYVEDNNTNIIYFIKSSMYNVGHGPTSNFENSTPNYIETEGNENIEYNNKIFYILYYDNGNQTYQFYPISEEEYLETEIDLRDEIFNVYPIVENENNKFIEFTFSERGIMELYFYNLYNKIINNDISNITNVNENFDITNVGDIEKYSYSTSKIIVEDSNNNRYEFTINAVLDYTVEITQND